MDGYIEDDNGVVVSTNYENPNGTYWFPYTGIKVVTKNTLVDVINVLGTIDTCRTSRSVNWINVAYWRFSKLDPIFIENK
jgi:hypothetical protein